MLFKDKLLQHHLGQNGYVVSQLLNPKQRHALNTFYEQIHLNEEPPELIENIHMTIWCSDSECNQKVKSKLEVFL